MPIYEYQCAACGHADSFLESMNAVSNKTCPKCGKRRSFKRLISAAGFQLKGQGWYATDFKTRKTTESNDGGKVKQDKSTDKNADKKTDKSADKNAGDGKKPTADKKAV